MSDKPKVLKRHSSPRFIGESSHSDTFFSAIVVKIIDNDTIKAGLWM